MSILHAVRRGRTAALTSGAALLVALTGAAVVPSADAASPTVTSIGVSSSSTTIHTSNGKKLVLQIYSGKDVTDSTSDAYFSVRLALPSGTESHSWYFQMPRSAFDINNDGKGTLSLGSAKLGDFGEISLKVTPIKPATYTSCKGVKTSKQRKVSIDGKLLFDTGSGWGTVGKGGAVHFADPSYAYWSYKNNVDCSSNYTMPCSSGTSWYASSYANGESVSISGGTYNGRSTMYGYRNQQLSKPSGASRTDIVTPDNPAAPKLTVKADNTAKMAVKGDSGTATLTSTGKGAKGTAEKCGKNGKKMQSTSWGSTYKNGPTHLKLHAQIFGALTLPDGQNTYSSFSKTKILP